MKAMTKVILFGLLLAANILTPHVLNAQCCKGCGYGGFIAETTRWDGSCYFYCTVTQCDTMGQNSANCLGGTFPCGDAYNDLCDTYVGCL
jgi:hypothetical protein